jgi:hypothetical protein
MKGRNCPSREIKVQGSVYIPNVKTVSEKFRYIRN